jgi:class 3 adenylate cyclase
MASFPAPDRAMAAAVRMRDAMRGINEARGKEDMILKIGIHEGPCIAVNLNERQDYFGQTVNIASRVQHLAASNEIFTTDAVLGDPGTHDLLAELGLKPLRQEVGLRGVSRDIGIFVIQ